MDAIANARRLRRDDTRDERALWAIVRNRKLDGFKFRRQVPVDRFFADFLCVEARLIVELDGGGHSETAVYDAERTKTLEACGYQVLRFWNLTVLREPQGVINDILAALRNAQGQPHNW